MKKRTEMILGIPVEIPTLDKVGEAERIRLGELALHEYETTGTLTSDVLQKANAAFCEMAPLYMLKDE